MVKVVQFKNFYGNLTRGQKIMSLLVLIIILLAVFMFWQKKHEYEVKHPSIKGLVTETVQEVEFSNFHELPAVVKAKVISVMASKVMGQIKTVDVKQGDRVTAGQKLLTIDTATLVQQVAISEAQYQSSVQAINIALERQKLANATFIRYKELFEKGAVSKQEFEQYENDKRVADASVVQAQMMANQSKANIELAQANKGFTVITAPFAGVITEKQAEAGAMAVPGMPLLTIEDDSALVVEANVDEKSIAYVKPQLPVKVFVDAVGSFIDAVVIEMSPGANNQARTFFVKATLNNRPDGLKSGQYAKLLLPTENKKGIILPGQAIVTRGELTGVFVVNADNNMLSFRVVRVNYLSDGRAEIVSGLNVGEIVVIDGVDKAIDGGILINKG